MKSTTAATRFLAALLLLAAQPVFSSPFVLPPQSQPQPQPPSSQPAKRRLDTNQLLGVVLSTFPSRLTVDGLSGSLTIAQKAIAAPLGVSTSQNNGACAKVNIMFARGTTEPGNVGLLAGPAFFEAVEDRVGQGNVAVQGTNNYAADVPGFLAGGDKTGSQQM